MSVLMLGSITIVAMVNNSITFIYYLAIEDTCLAIVATVIHAALPVHVTDAAKINENHLVDGLKAVLSFVSHCDSQPERNWTIDTHLV